MKNNVCPNCKKEYEGFRNQESINEYKLSQLCQNCQDVAFGNEQDMNIADALCPNCGNYYNSEKSPYGDMLCSKSCHDSYMAYLANPY